MLRSPTASSVKIIRLELAQCIFYKKIPTFCASIFSPAHCLGMSSKNRSLLNQMLNLCASFLLFATVSAVSIPVDGVTVLCNKGASGLYRYVGQELRRYPNPSTAKYYDPAYTTNFVELDCTGK